MKTSDILITGAVLAAAAVAASSGSKKPTSGSGGTPPTPPNSGGGGGGGTQDPDDPWSALPNPLEEGHDAIQTLGILANLDVGWINFLSATAWGESGFNNLRGLGRPAWAPDWAQMNTQASAMRQENESDAALKAFDRNKSRYEDCPWPRERYGFGSGGWWAVLPANALKAFWNTELQCIDPYAVFDPIPSLVMAMEYARGLMNWTGFKKAPTWLNLRVGWGNPSNMGDPQEMDRIANGNRKFGDALDAIGVQRSFMDQNVTSLPEKDPVGLFDFLKQVY